MRYDQNFRFSVKRYVGRKNIIFTQKNQIQIHLWQIFFFQAINDCELLNRGIEMSFECPIVLMPD